MEKKSKILLLVVNVLLFVMEIIGTTFCFVDGGIAALRYYTVLSNIMCGIISLIYIVVLVNNLNSDDFVIAKWMKTLRFIVVVCLSVTFIVVITVLIPTYGASSISGYLFERANLFHHTLCPLFMVIVYLLFEKEIKLGRREELFTLIPTVLYAIVTLTLNILKVMEGPYPFLYVYEQSVFESIMWVVIIVGGAYALAIGLNKLNRIGGNK